MSIPIIGLTTYHGKSEYGFPAVMLLRAYLAAVIQAGGAPVLLPSELPLESWKTLYRHLDGVLLTGGGDIAIQHFQGEPHPKISEIDQERDALELNLLHDLIEDGKPFLGICRGFQAVNVALGGTLYTHIADQLPNALKHDYYPDWPRDHPAHPVRVGADSRLADILGETELTVNSLHHQGARDLGPALAPAVYSPDGLVEALELPGHPFGIGVQWHPEWLTDQPAAQRLFRAFVEAAGYR